MTYSQPLLPLFLLLALGSLIGVRRACRRRGHWLDFAGIGGVFLCCWPVTAWLFAASLEHGYAAAHYPAGDAEAIVVLAGNAYAANASQPEAEPGSSTQIRAAHAAWLFQHWKRLPIAVSGGAFPEAGGEGGEVTLAGLMRRQLLMAGVPDSMIWVEDRSESTYENATGTATVLREHGIHRVALVTEGFHIWRSELCFRKQGFEVTPAPCAFRTLERRTWKGLMMPGLWGLRVNEECLHEWAGLIWYKLRGRI